MGNELTAQDLHRRGSFDVEHPLRQLRNPPLVISRLELGVFRKEISPAEHTLGGKRDVAAWSIAGQDDVVVLPHHLTVSHPDEVDARRLRLRSRVRARTRQEPAVDDLDNLARVTVETDQHRHRCLTPRRLRVRFFHFDVVTLEVKLRAGDHRVRYRREDRKADANKFCRHCRWRHRREQRLAFVKNATVCRTLRLNAGNDVVEAEVEGADGVHLYKIHGDVASGVGTNGARGCDLVVREDEGVDGVKLANSNTEAVRCTVELKVVVRDLNERGLEQTVKGQAVGVGLDSC